MLVVDEAHWILKDLTLSGISEDTVWRARHFGRLRSYDVDLAGSRLLNKLTLVELNELLTAFLIRNAGQELTWRDILTERIGVER